jgi:hypothetical protein
VINFSQNHQGFIFGIRSRDVLDDGKYGKWLEMDIRMPKTQGSLTAGAYALGIHGTSGTKIIESKRYIWRMSHDMFPKLVRTLTAWEKARNQWLSGSEMQPGREITNFSGQRPGVDSGEIDLAFSAIKHRKSEDNSEEYFDLWIIDRSKTDIEAAWGGRRWVVPAELVIAFLESTRLAYPTETTSLRKTLYMPRQHLLTS